MPESLNEKTFLDLFKALLRYTASGFIFIIALQFFREDLSIWKFTENNINWSIVIVAGICGIIMYSFHLSFLDDIFYYLSLYYLIKIKKDNDYYMPKEFKIDDKSVQDTGIDVRRIKFSLTTHRLERPGADDKRSQAIQDYIDHQFAVLVFLYTSSYSLISLPIFYSLKNISNTKLINIGFDVEYTLIFLLGFFLLISGFFLDLKITKRELFLVMKTESLTNATLTGVEPKQPSA